MSDVTTNATTRRAIAENALANQLALRLQPQSTNPLCDLALMLAWDIRRQMNLHAASDVTHATADGVNFPVGASDPLDLTALLTFTALLITAYSAHEADAALPAGWAYHIAQESGSHALASTTPPTTLILAVAMLNDMKTKFNAHAVDFSAHNAPAVGNVTTSAALNELGIFTGVDSELYYYDGNHTAFKLTNNGSAAGGAGSPLTSAYFWVGNVSDVAAAVAMSGEASLSNLGAVTLANSAVIGKVLTGFSAGSGHLVNTDTILGAFQKLEGTNLFSRAATTIAPLTANDSIDVGTGLMASAGFKTASGVVTEPFGGTKTGIYSKALELWYWDGSYDVRITKGGLTNGGYTTTSTAGATTTLTVDSTYLQYFTGTLAQTVVLPVTSTLVLGRQFQIVNNSTLAVTVNSSGGNLVTTVSGSSSAVITCILTSGIGAASWSVLIAMPPLTQDHIFVGSASNVATDVAMSSEASIVASGAVTLSNAAVISKLLTGFTSGAGIVGATDSLLGAIQKLDGNITYQMLAGGTGGYLNELTYSTTGDTTTSATFEDITAMVDQTISVPISGSYLFTLDTLITGASNDCMVGLGLVIDGGTATQMGSSAPLDSAVSYDNITRHVIITLSAGSHTIRPQWRRSLGAGTPTLVNGNAWLLYVQAMGAGINGLEVAESTIGSDYSIPTGAYGSTGHSCTFNCLQGERVQVSFIGRTSCTVSADPRFAYRIDAGADIVIHGDYLSTGTGDATEAVSFSFLTQPLNAGPHTLALRAQLTSGTAVLKGTSTLTDSRLQVTRFKSNGLGAGTVVTKSVLASPYTPPVQNTIYDTGVEVTFHTIEDEVVTVLGLGAITIASGYLGTQFLLELDGGVMSRYYALPTGTTSLPIRFSFPINYITAPLTAGTHTIKLQVLYATASGQPIVTSTQSLGGPTFLAAVQYRGGVIPIQQAGTTITETPTHINFIGATVTPAILGVDVEWDSPGSGRRQIYDVTAGAVPPASGAVGTNLGFFQSQDFDPDTNNDLYFQFALPDNVDLASPVKMVLKYCMSTNHAGNVKMSLDYIASNLAADVDPAVATASLTSTFTPGANAELLRKHESFEVAVGDLLSADMMVSCHLTRNAIDGADTHTGKFQLLSIEIYYVATDASGGGGTSIPLWSDWTPTGSWTTNTTYKGTKRLVGDTLECYVTVYLTGAPTSAVLTVNLPAGYTIDWSKLPDGCFAQRLGGGIVYDAAPANYYCEVQVAESVSSTQVLPKAVITSGTYGVTASVTQAVPITFATGDEISIYFSVPVIAP